MNDILIVSVTIKEHIDTLRKVLELLVTNKLQLRIDKCTFLRTEIEFVGYLIMEGEIRPTKEGINTVQKSQTY